VNKRQIIIITSSYPDSTSPDIAAGPFAAEFAHALSHQARVTVLAASLCPRVEKNGNLTVHYFRVSTMPMSQLRLTRPTDWPALVRSMHAGHTALKHLLSGIRPDHVLAMWAVPAGLWAMLACKSFRIPFSTWSLGSDILVLGKLPLVRSLIRRILRTAHRRFADGFGLAAEVEQLSSMPCIFLPTTRHLPDRGDKSLSTNPPFNLAYLGRMHPIKGIDLLLEALALLNDSEWAQIKSVRICGNGPLAEQIKKTCQELADGGRPVSFCGPLDEPGVADLLHWADYLMLPSRSESVPVVFSEAMQMQTPIICTPVGDMPLLMKRYGIGCMSEDFSVNGFAEAIRQGLRSNPAEFESDMRRTLEDFDAAAAASTFLEEI